MFFSKLQKEKDQHLLPPAKHMGKYTIPRHIKPELQLAHIEILCWGVRCTPTQSSALGLSTAALLFECQSDSVRSLASKFRSANFNFETTTLILKTVCVSAIIWINILKSIIQPLYMTYLGNISPLVKYKWYRDRWLIVDGLANINSSHIVLLEQVSV